MIRGEMFITLRRRKSLSFKKNTIGWAEELGMVFRKDESPGFWVIKVREIRGCQL